MNAWVCLKVRATEKQVTSQQAQEPVISGRGLFLPLPLHPASVEIKNLLAGCQPGSMFVLITLPSQSLYGSSIR